MLGYRAVYDASGTRRLEVDEDGAKVVRTIFSMFLDGGSAHSIMRWLNAHGVAAPRGGEWNRNRVLATLKQEAYLGRLVWGRTTRIEDPNGEEGDMLRVTATEAAIRVDDAFPAIIDQETFDKAQARLKRTRRDFPVAKECPEAYLRGVIMCAACGYAASPSYRNNANGEPVWYYSCSHKRRGEKTTAEGCSGFVRKAFVDEVVSAFLEAEICKPSNERTLREAVRTYNTAARTYEGVDEAELLRAREASLIRQHDAAKRDYKRTGSETFADMIVEAEQELAKVREQLATLNSAIKAAHQELDETAVVDAAKALRAAIKAQDYERIGRFMKELISRIDLDLTKRLNTERVVYSYESPSQAVDEPLTLADHRWIAKQTSVDAIRKRFPFFGESLNTADAMLRFTMRWNLGNLESIGEAALRSIGAASA